MEAVNLAEAKTRLSELVARAEAGEDIRISRRGRPAVRLVPEDTPKVPIDLAALEALSAGLAFDLTESVIEMRRLDRY